tara:strand:+ start:39435 stop:39845 length:411 start_codon:yes stop_codon:yes gene_type:complete
MVKMHAAKIYVVVFTLENGDTQFLLDNSEIVAGSDYGHLVERIGKTVNHLKWLIAGSPTKRSNFFFGTRTEYTELSDDTKKRYRQMVNTIRIEPIHDVVLGTPGKHLVSMRSESEARRAKHSVDKDNRTDLERHAK